MKKEKNINKRKITKNQIITGLIIGIISGLMGLFSNSVPFIQKTELKTLDLRFKLRPKIKICEDIGYLDYDDASLELFGLWPWPRNRQVALIDTIKFYNARAVGYDVFFSEKSNIILYPDKIISDLNKKFSQGIPDKDELLKITGNAFKDYDSEFAESIRHADNVYLAQFMQFPSENIAGKPFEELKKLIKENQKTFSSDKLKSLEDLRQYAISDKLPQFNKVYKNHLFKVYDFVAPLPKFAMVSAGVGFAQIVKDLDYTVRLFPTFLYYDGYIYPALSFQMASDILDFKLNDLEVVPNKYVLIKNALIYGTKHRQTIKIPIDKHCQFLVDWAGGFNNTFFHYSYKTISYYYAFIKVKEIARNIDPEKEDLNSVFNKLKDYIKQESLVEESEIDDIAAPVALAWYMDNDIINGKSYDSILNKIKNEYLKKYINDVYWSEKISRDLISELNKNKNITFKEFISGQKYFINDKYAEEIYDNIKWFYSHNRINDVRPFYFPHKQSILINGQKVKVSPMYLENKILMVGLTGAGTIDLNPMPFEQNCPMVALHTNALNMLLTNQSIYFTPELYKKLIPFIIGLFLGFIITIMSVSRGSIFVFLFSLFYTAMVWLAWIQYSTWLTLVSPILAVFITYLSVMIYKYIQTIVERKKIRNIFSTMVSPKVLRVMEDNPELLSLTGERKSATTMFSMINGFNQVTDSVSPDYLSKILSVYLTPTSEIIMDYDGYIDKYEGHIIMADFGVPLDDNDNPWKCAFACVEQQLDIEPFIYHIYLNFGVKVRTTMGFNFGYISAGNMGSEKKMQYTVMGDAVNVGARFMPANLIYNTRVITGGDTYDKIKDYTEIRKLDKLLLKGKTAPTIIYELLGWNKDAYKKLLSSISVPESLLTRWKIAPGGKILGYYRFWKNKYKETNISLAGKIADFFKSNIEYALNNIVVQNKIFFLELEREIELLCIANNIDTKLVRNTDYEKLLDNCLNKIVKPVKEELGKKSQNKEQIHNIQLLENKLNMFKSKLDLKDDIEEVVINSFDSIKEFMVMSDRKETFETLTDIKIKDRNKYHGRVVRFYDQIKSNPKEYREMMAAAGSIDDKKKQARDIYENSIEKYWVKDWDNALAGFKKCLEIIPDDAPSLCLIERINEYKENPPPSGWQGEFIQTKK